MKNFIKREFDPFEELMENLTRPVSSQMKTDASETEKSYLFAIDMPGYDKNEIEISMDNGYLNVSANKQEETEENQKGYIFRERKTGSCSRSFYLGDVSDENISAKYENGTLCIEVPKQEKIDTCRKIQIS